jgi:hypothetical protein
MVSGIPNCEALEKSSCDNSRGENGIATIMIHDRTIRELAHEYHYNIKFDCVPDATKCERSYEHSNRL